jgi:hypothetical protein
MIEPDTQRAIIERGFTILDLSAITTIPQTINALIIRVPGAQIGKPK